MEKEEVENIIMERRKSFQREQLVNMLSNIRQKERDLNFLKQRFSEELKKEFGNDDEEQLAITRIK